MGAAKLKVVDGGGRPRRAPSPEAKAQLKLVKAIEKAEARFGPAADAIVNFDRKLDLLCAWLKKWAPWGLFSAPFIWTAIQGSSPKLAEWLGAFLKGLA
jgi:hypothetical protein